MDPVISPTKNASGKCMDIIGEVTLAVQLAGMNNITYQIFNVVNTDVSKAIIWGRHFMPANSRRRTSVARSFN